MEAAANWRAPTVPEGEILLHDEPGRVLDQDSYRVCYSAYHYRLTQAGKGGRLMLRVKHGGGEECQGLGYPNPQNLAAFAALDSNGRFILFHMLRTAGADGAKHAAASVRHEYAQAFTDGRLRKRKERGVNRVKVWIEPAASAA
jgi:hypothetical protein